MYKSKAEERKICEQQIWGNFAVFWPSLKPTTGNNFKKASLRIQTSVEMNFLHKIQVTCCGIGPERDAYILLCINFCFYGPDQPILKMQAEERLV